MQVQNSSLYYSITAQANATVIVLSILLIIVGVVMTATSICQLVAGRKKLDDDGFHDFGPYIVKFIIEIVRITIIINNKISYSYLLWQVVVGVTILLILIVIAVGIAAAVLSGTVSQAVL